MSTGKSTRRNKGTDPPVLPLTTSQSQLSRLPVSTLQLYLNQFQLAQDGNKAAKVQRLYAHLQSLQGTTQTASNSSSQSDSSYHSSDSNSSSQSDYDSPRKIPLFLTRQVFTDPDTARTIPQLVAWPPFLRLNGKLLGDYLIGHEREGA